MLGTPVRGDFEHCEVALFVGKNPWQSHGIPRARTTLKEIANDPARSLIVIDPRRTETAELADFHLQVRPGTRRLAARRAGRRARRGGPARPARGWPSTPTGLDEVDGRAAARSPIAEYCRDRRRRRGPRARAPPGGSPRPSSVAVFEDLGVQMNRHSTLVSYLEKLVWLLTGNFGKPGAQYVADVAGQPRAHEPARARPGGARRAARSPAPASSPG